MCQAKKVPRRFQNSARWLATIMLPMAFIACGESSSDEPTGGHMPADAATDTSADVEQDVDPDDAAADATADAAPDRSDAGGSAPCVAAPRGTRLLGVDLLDPPASGDFDVNLAKGRELGIDFIALHVTWPSIEPAPGVFEDPGGALGALAGVAQNEGWKFSVTLRPIDLTGKTVPSDLEGTRFSDPTMLTRFNAIVDFVLTVVPAEILTSLQVGNEIDGFDASSEHPEFWSDYGTFLAGVTDHVHQQHPGVRVGYTGTFAGMTEGTLHDLGVWTALAGVVDVVGVTYYPMAAAFQVRSPEDVYADFDKIAATFPESTILLQEVGYQTAESCGSDDAMQETFYAHVFCAWDQHQSQFETMNIVRLHDVSRADAEDMAGPYGLGDEPFLEYLRTIGIRTHEGVDKPAFVTTREAAAARGFE